MGLLHRPECVAKLLFAKEEKELDEQIARLKHDQELLREGPLCAFISVPNEMDQGPHLPGIG